MHAQGAAMNQYRIHAKDDGESVTKLFEADSGAEAPVETFTIKLISSPQDVVFHKFIFQAGATILS